jgi:hypothetical protein
MKWVSLLMATSSLLEFWQESIDDCSHEAGKLDHFIIYKNIFYCIEWVSFQKAISRPKFRHESIDNNSCSVGKLEQFIK